MTQKEGATGLFRYRTGVITFEFLLHSTFPKRILSNISHFL